MVHNEEVNKKNQVEYDKDRPAVIFTEKIWRKAIENKLVDFTEEQLDLAVKGNGIIMVGNLPGCGVVNMCVDGYFPDRCRSVYNKAIRDGVLGMGPGEYRNISFKEQLEVRNPDAIFMTVPKKDTL